jgi:outer membrane biosynthesis protein TonB
MNAEFKHTYSFAGGDCLSPDSLRRYLGGTLPKNSIHGVEKHLLNCEFCATVLEDMDVNQGADFVAQNIAKNVNARISEIIGSGPRLGFWIQYKTVIQLTSAFFLLGTAILFYLYTPSSHSNTKVIAPKVPAVALAPIASRSESEPKILAGKAKEEEIELKKRNSDPPILISSPKKEELKMEPSNPDNAKPENTEIKTSPVMAEPTLPIKKESPSTEVLAEKENYASLQIVSAKVLQKMSKTEGNTRKASKNGQISVSKSKNPSYFLLEDMPQYPGGDAAMEDFLSRNFKNPIKDKRNLTGQTVAVMFTVSSKGKLSDIEITRSIAPELDVEVIRLLTAMPQWDPGKHKGDITCVLALTVK